MTKLLGTIVKAGIFVKTIQNNGKLDLAIVEQLLRSVEKYLQAMSFIGVGVSVLFLEQSWSARDGVNRIKTQFIKLGDISPKKFGTPNDYLEYVSKRTSETRNQILALKSNEWYWELTKTVFALFSALESYSTKSIILKISSLFASSVSGIARLYNFYNYYELKQLLDLVEQHGYIV